jgi:hypothetical protein
MSVGTLGLILPLKRFFLQTMYALLTNDLTKISHVNSEVPLQPESVPIRNSLCEHVTDTF